MDKAEVNEEMYRIFSSYNKEDLIWTTIDIMTSEAKIEWIKAWHEGDIPSL